LIQRLILFETTYLIIVLILYLMNNF